MSEVAARATSFASDSVRAGGRTLGCAIKYYLYGIGAQIALAVWVVGAGFGFGFANELWGFGAGAAGAIVGLLLTTALVGAVRTAVTDDE
jgi:hypothetical protein